MQTIKSQIIPLGAAAAFGLLYFVVPEARWPQLIGIHITFAIAYLAYIAAAIARTNATLPLTLQALPSAELTERCQRSIDHLSRIAQQTDRRFQALCEPRLDQLDAGYDSLARGWIEFNDDSWRAAWEHLLDPSQASFYWSVALIEHERYWDSRWGDHCFAFTRDKQYAQGSCRYFIVADHLLHSPAVHDKIARYCDCTSSSYVLPMSMVRAEHSDLLIDLGIYGDHAAGRQISNCEGKTDLFRLSFAHNDGGTPYDYAQLRQTFEQINKLFRDAGERFIADYLAGADTHRRSA